MYVNKLILGRASVDEAKFWGHIIFGNYIAIQFIDIVMSIQPRILVMDIEKFTGTSFNFFLHLFIYLSMTI